MRANRRALFGATVFVLIVVLWCGSHQQEDWKAPTKIDPSRAAWLSAETRLEAVITHAEATIRDIGTWDVAMASFRSFRDAHDRFLREVDDLPKADGTLTKEDIQPLISSYHQANTTFSAIVIINDPGGSLTHELYEFGDLTGVNRAAKTSELRTVWRTSIDNAVGILRGLLAKRGIEPGEVARYGTATAQTPLPMLTPFRAREPIGR